MQLASNFLWPFVHIWLVQIQLLSDRNVHRSHEVHGVNNEFDTSDDDDDDNGAIVPYMMVL